MFIKKIKKGYILINSIIILSLIIIIATVLIKLATIKLQDSYYYSKSNQVREFSIKEEQYIKEIETLINSDDSRRNLFIENYNNKEKVIYVYNSTVSIIFLSDKVYLKEKKMDLRRLKEIKINISSSITITPGMYKTNFEVDNDRL